MADSERMTELVAQLKEMDSACIKFVEAKKRLRAEGYSDTEIANGLYRFSYDGIPNVEHVDTAKEAMRQYYTTHPADAQKVGKFILRQQQEAEYSEYMANVMASQYAPDEHSRSTYAFRAAEQAGFPYLSLLVLLLVIEIPVIIYDLPGYLLYAPGVIAVIYIIVSEFLRR